MADTMKGLMTDRMHRWVRSVLSPDDEIEKLREQFYVTLRAYQARVEARPPANDATLKRVRELLAPGRRPRWSECYEVEQLLVDLFDPATLRTELGIRLTEARANLSPALAEFYEREAREAAGAPEVPADHATGAGTGAKEANGHVVGNGIAGQTALPPNAGGAGGAPGQANDKAAQGTPDAAHEASGPSGEAASSGTPVSVIVAPSPTTNGAAAPPARGAHPVADVERQRTLLARLINDLQWRYTIQEGKRRFSKSLTTRTGICFLIALLSFAGVIALLYLKRWRFSLDDLRLLYVAGIAGAWGASFSMLSGLKGRIDESEIYDLNTMRAVTMVAARALIGAGAASILYLFFYSGLLSGAAFPNLAKPGDKCPFILFDPSVGCVPSRDMALIVVWCFIAGFSEKLIPSLLDKTGSKLGGESDRYRPTESRTGGAPPSTAGLGGGSASGIGANSSNGKVGG